MGQRYIALVAGVAFGAMVALHGGVAMAKTACKKNCRSAFSDCKAGVKTDDGQVKEFLAGLKAFCKGLDKQQKKDCLKNLYKGEKQKARLSKKAALKRCKVDKGCRTDFCEDQASLAGDDSCLVSSPADSYGECLEAGLL